MNMEKNKEHIVAVISDTHGLLRPEAVNNLENVDLIIHAGDIDEPVIINKLKGLAPLIAVRGNMDRGSWAGLLPKYEIVKIDHVTFYVRHDLTEIDLAPEASGIDVVISGHTHHPALNKKNGVLFLNPGSLGPRRSGHPISMALLYINKKVSNVKMIELED